MKQPILTGSWGKCHIQGIAADPEKGYIYYSFTTKLVKARMDGTIVGCVDGLMGHLGCIAFNRQDGRVYGSLEYKNDSIGKGILKSLGSDAALEDAFYMAIFDVDRIDRMDMDAEKDGIMTSVYLREVVEDYNAPGHRFGCSGIDGTTFGPMPGASDGKQYLFVAYGIYSDVTREDNDCQVLLCYDTADWAGFESPLSQRSMHKNGPAAPKEKLFVYTGNTTYGVQNLEYDAAQNAYFMAVYPGKKPQFPNYYLFAVDAAKAPEKGRLSLKKMGNYHEASNTYGWNFKYGSTGLYSYGNGDWLISHNAVSQSGQCGIIHTYVFDEKYGFILKD
ncbi:MAG: hypothetical protein IJ043_09420 [Clostridia bacterium]|nr:hypothetical protein [Clostridia bacterium]